MQKYAHYLLCFLLFICSSGFSDQKLLINAEPFGFGPAAAMAHVFPHLRPHIKEIGFIGAGHVLDLHRKLPYDKIHDVNPQNADAFIEECKHYDLFLTASDFEAAALAKKAGCKVIIYDPLTWYWSQLPKIIFESDLYLAQNFYGVTQRLEMSNIKQGRVVPPLTQAIKNPAPNENTLFVNFGGLRNPFIKEKQLQEYVDFISNCIELTLGNEFDEVKIGTSSSIANALTSRHPIQTYTPQNSQEMLASSRLVFMTPGLGNIYDAAEAKTQVFWLPPTNDSQGQQLRLLIKYGLDPLAIDWHDILDRDPINYFDSQDKVLKQIAEYMNEAAHSPKAMGKLSRHLRYLYRKGFTERPNPLLHKLIEEFGDDGSAKMSEEILNWLKTHAKES